MYDAVSDPYCYDGTTILKNRANIREAVALELFEHAMPQQRTDEPFPSGRLGVAHYRAIHRHLFQDVYAWVGKFRTVRIAKDGHAFCYPEHIAHEIQALFSALKRQRFFRETKVAGFVADATSFLSTLNAIHSFREGDGPTQLSFMTVLASHAGHPFDLDRLDPERFLSAMIASFRGNERPLSRMLARLVASR
jgi:cell filamentation protein